MKKLFTLILSLLLTGVYTTASAQQNIFVWEKNGKLSVVSAASIDSVSFSVGSWLFNIATSTPVGITNNSFKAMASVSLNQNVKSLSVSPVVGVCFSNENKQPTCNDYYVSLGNSMTDYTICIEGVDSGTTYYYRTYVELLDEVYYDSNVMSVTTLGTKPVDNDNNVYVVINNHKFVDLGLPSGLLWAQSNVGASSVYGVGEIYAWGETETKGVYSWDTYKWGDGDNFTKYSNNDNKTTLDASDDVATVKWGEGCRMPSYSEFQELRDKCIWKWKSGHYGIDGYWVTGPNGSSIFLPASGNYGKSPGGYGSYWSATLFSRFRRSAHYLDFSNDYVDPEGDSYYGRCYGYTVRPVAER